MFSKDLYCRHVKKQGLFEKGLRLRHLSFIKSFLVCIFRMLRGASTNSKLEVQVICVLLVIALTSVEARLSTLKRGRYEFLEPFCNGKDIYVAIPWDCTGFVHCSHLGAQPDAYWLRCPQNLFYSMEAKTCTWPKDMRKPCPPLKGKIIYFSIFINFINLKIPLNASPKQKRHTLHV